jgi:hypothetical protein
MLDLWVKILLVSWCVIVMKTAIKFKSKAVKKGTLSALNLVFFGYFKAEKIFALIVSSSPKPLIFTCLGAPAVPLFAQSP